MSDLTPVLKGSWRVPTSDQADYGYGVTVEVGDTELDNGELWPERKNG